MLKKNGKKAFSFRVPNTYIGQYMTRSLDSSGYYPCTNERLEAVTHYQNVSVDVCRKSKPD